MQKKIIALAIAGLSSAAFAQSNVTISGAMNMAVDTYSATGSELSRSTAGVNRSAEVVSRLRLSDTSSNIRFAGEEALGGGNAAWFQIESSLIPDVSGGTLASRNTAVGLKGSWGEFGMGRWDTHYTADGAVDAFGSSNSNMMAARGILMGQGQLGAVTLGGRLNNQLFYTSPTFGGGFAARVSYARNVETPFAPAAVAAWSDNKKESELTITPTYTNGPISAFYSYYRAADISLPVAATTSYNVIGVAGTVHTASAGQAFATHRGDKLGARYAFKNGLGVGLIYDRSRAEFTEVATWQNQVRTAWAVPVDYTVGAHRFGFTYAKAGKLRGANNLGAASSSTFDGGDTDASMVTVQYGYSWSKRTTAYAGFGQINNKARAFYNFFGESAAATTGTPAGTIANMGADPRIFAVGLKHTF